MATNLNPEPALHDAPDSGTPIINYVGPAALAPLPEATPAPIPDPDEQAEPPADSALSWAKRVHIALVVVFSGSLLYPYLIGAYYPRDILGNAILIVLWLVGMGVARERSHHAEWGLIAFVSAVLAGLALHNGFAFIGLMDWAARNGVSLASSYIVQDVFSLIMALGFVLLTSFAMVKSLKPRRTAIGLLAVLAIIVSELLLQVQDGPPFTAARDELVSNLNSWGIWLANLSPLLVFILYVWPGGARRQPDTPPPNGKPQS